MGVALALAAMAIVSTAGPALGWSAGSMSPSDESLLFSLTNQDRASAGLNSLVNDSYLHKEAEWRAKDMGDRNYFSHQIPPNNSMVFAYMQQDGYCFKVAGENIGLSTWGDDVATNRIEVAFMGSTSHRANILGNWARMGVGAYKAADGRKLYAVLFSIPCGVTVPTPTPVKTPAPTPGNPTPLPTSGATQKPVTNPTGNPTPKPTIKPVTTQGPNVTASSTMSPTATPSAGPSATPASTTAALTTPSARPTTPSAGRTTTPVVPTSPPTEKILNLRVREKPANQSPFDSLFHSLFGGLFGW